MAQAKKRFTPFHSTYEAFNRRVMVWICRSCDTWCENKKPTYCTTCGGTEFFYFASKAEAKRYAELLLMEKGGVIQNLEPQLSFPLVVNDLKICEYRADFVYDEQGRTIIEDVKAKGGGDKAVTKLFEVKRKLVKALYDIDITIVRR